MADASAASISRTGTACPSELARRRPRPNLLESLCQVLAPATVKQHLPAIRTLFDWLALGHVVRHNPAAAVRGPKHVDRTGKTPVLSSYGRIWCTDELSRAACLC